jgi:membrane-anchored mycosin MYCP
VRARLTRRLSTTAAAALLAVLVPAAPVAGAQPSSQPGQPGQPAQPDVAGATPPPLTDRSAPGDDGQPDHDYTRTAEACVRSNAGAVKLNTIPWGQEVLQFDALHKFATGKGQTIAVIDTGVNKHAYLGGRLSGGGDYVQRGGTGLDDCDGHGTEVAGVIAAFPNDDTVGFQGIAYDAKIVSIRQSSDLYEFKPANQNSGGEEKAGSLATLAKAVVNAANRHVDVINMSVDTCRLAADPAVPGQISGAELLLQRALRFAVEDRDVVLVSSAGNTPSGKCGEQNNSDPDHPTYIVSPPWFSEYVLSVAAVQRDGDPATFSMHGPWVSVAAPGTDIISLDPGSENGLASASGTANGQLNPIQGTSFAAPYVSGLAALIRERFEKLGKKLTAKEVMARIKATASHPASTEGHNNQVGYGMIDPIGALTAKIPGQDGISADAAVDTPFRMPPAQPRDWAPEKVAVIGSGGGLGLLLLTLFVVHTVRRQRRDRAGPA